MDFQQMFKSIGQYTSKNSPTILSGAAVAGVIATAVLAVRATPKALAELAGQQMDKEDGAFTKGLPPEEVDKVSGLSTKEIVKATWKFYIPAALTGAATIACIIGANQIGARRYAALAGAYTLAEKTFREYKDEVVKQIGEKKEEKIREEINDRHIRELPENTQVIITGMGEQACYDKFTGRLFKSDIETIRRAANDVNQEILTGAHMGVELNRFYELLGLERVEAGDILGWNVDHMMDLKFTSHLSECNIPTIAVDFKYPPVYDYGKI
jgi:Family of unknown function (DUF6353)